MLINLACKLVFEYYSNSKNIPGNRLLLDKEPLEPIAFPLREYELFMALVHEKFDKSGVTV